MSLVVEKLTFAYRHNTPLLNELSFAVEAGQACCLLGPNGAGKTTLIRCIVGLAQPSAGAVSVDGQRVADLSAPLRARRIAYVPQTAESAFAFTVLDMVAAGRTAYVRFGGMPTVSDWQAARDALEWVGIPQLAERSYNQISGGERQLVTIARALAQQTPVIVLDEPTSALDYGNQVRVLGIIRSLARSGKAVLMSSHAPNQAFDAADIVLLLKDGRIIAAGPPAAVIDGRTLTGLYGVAIDVVEAHGHDHQRWVCIPDLGEHPTPPTSEREQA